MSKDFKDGVKSGKAYASEVGKEKARLYLESKQDYHDDCTAKGVIEYWRGFSQGIEEHQEP